MYAYIMGMFCPGIFLYGYVLSGYVFPGIFSTGMFFRVCYFLDPFENMTSQSPLHAKLVSLGFCSFRYYRLFRRVAPS